MLQIHDIMKHTQEKGATAKQAFPFQVCFNEQIFCEAERKAL